MDGLDREIVATVQRALSQVTSFVEMSLRAGEFIRSQEILNVQFATHKVPGVDLGTHNCPTCKEVAAILLTIMLEPKETLFCSIEMGD
jgi:hypothetical protein